MATYYGATYQGGHIYSVYDHAHIPSVIICGDFNNDFNRGDACSKSYIDFCVKNNLSFCNQFGDLVNYTYHSIVNNCYSLLDYLVVSNDLVDKVSDIIVIDSALNFSDHLPIKCDIMVKICESTQSTVATDCPREVFKNYKLKWSTCDKNLYYRRTCDYLSAIRIPSIGSLDDNNDKNSEILRIYECLVDALIRASSEVVPVSRGRVEKSWWNEHLSNLKSNSCCTFNEWLSNGKPKYGIVYENMISAKLKFKLAIKTCKKNDETNFVQKCERDIGDKNFNSFWKSWNMKFSKNYILTELHITELYILYCSFSI